MYSFIDVTVSQQYMPLTNILYYHFLRCKEKEQAEVCWDMIALLITMFAKTFSVVFVLMSQQKLFQNSYFLT